MREYLVQLLKVESIKDSDIPAVAVPSSDKFEQPAAYRLARHLMVNSGVQIATANRLNEIRDLEDTVA